VIRTFAALAEPTRLRIVEYLGARPRSVGEICGALALAQPQASKHLRVLRDSGVVDVVARAQHRIYSLRAAALKQMDEWLERYRGMWSDRLDQMDEVIEEMKNEEKRGRGR
jgi:DNA-binding transcriptional ArsR family regulator